MENFKLGFPDLDIPLQSLLQYQTYIQTHSSYYIQAESIPEQDSLLKVYSFQIPEPSQSMKSQGFTGLYSFTLTICKIQLDNEFLTSGGLGVLFGKQSVVSSNMRDLSCLTKKTCVFGRKLNKNSSTIFSAFTPGKYSAGIFYTGPQSGERQMMASIGNILPYSVYFKLEPLVQTEDKFNCQAGTLVHSLNSPGMMDQRGFLRYSDRVLADFRSPVQKTSLQVEEISILRVNTVEPSGIDVNIKLIQYGQILAETDMVGMSEGILVEIERGEYELAFNVVNSILEDPRHKFCQTFLVQIGVSPLSAVEDQSIFYGLNSCIGPQIQLEKLVKNLEKSLAQQQKFNQITNPSTYFKLPAQPEVYSGDFKVQSGTFAYFEVFSDFVLADLGIALKRRSTVIRGNSDNLLELGNHNRKSFSIYLSKGTYQFSIYQQENTDKLRKKEAQLPNCVAFQLRIKIFPIQKSAIEKWPCFKQDTHLYIQTLNTLDKLGVKGAPAQSIPKTVYFSNKIMAPFSSSNSTSRHLINFYPNQDSILRAFIKSENSPMKIQLKLGQNILRTQQGGLSTLYTLSHQLQAFRTYSLQVFYYPWVARTCHTYSINLQIGPVLEPEQCQTKLPEKEFIKQRVIQDNRHFSFHLDSGFAPTSLLNTYTYGYQQVLQHKIDFTMPASSSLISGELQVDLLKAPLLALITSKGEILHLGGYSAPHKYELLPFPLANGEYSVIITEDNEFSMGCRKFTGRILLQELAIYEDIRTFVKKTEVCNFFDQSNDLNIVGQLESGRLHWYKKLEIDLEIQRNQYIFSVEETSLVRVFILPRKDIDFQVSLMRKEQGKYNRVAQVYVVELNDGIHQIVEQGIYKIEIKFEGDPMPTKRECPFFEMDLQIMPKQEFDQLQQAYTCPKVDYLPSQINQALYQQEFQLKGSIDKKIEINLQKDSEIEVSLSFDNTLSGYISFKVLQNLQHLFSSVNYQNLSTLKQKLPAGQYQLQIQNSNSLAFNACFPLIFDFKSTPISQFVCQANSLPESLFKTTEYGGPQNMDGTISFHGVFRIKQGISSQVLKFYGLQTSIARILTISHNPNIWIQSAVYSDKNLKHLLAYSKVSTYMGSFIFDVKPQKSPYYLVLTYIKNQIDQACLTFDLKIVIQTTEKVGNMLECKITKKSIYQMLPHSVLEFGKLPQQYSDDRFAILDRWIQAGQKNLPLGVRSNGSILQPFTFDIELTTGRKAWVSVSTEYDFLTNGLQIFILENQQEIVSSKWVLISDNEEEETFNFGSEIEGETLEAGVYTIRIKQYIAANHLLQRYEDMSVCFPFGLSIEYIPIQEERQAENPLILVTPSHLTNHNPNNKLEIILSFKYPLPDIKYKESVYFKQDSGDILKPDGVLFNPFYTERLKVIFKGPFKAGQCSQLVFDSSLLDTDQVIVSDGLKHVYCMMNCFCNPNSKAVCNQAMQCVCPVPYTGPLCYQCVQNYFSQKNQCIKVGIQSVPVISYIEFDTEQPVKLDQQIPLIFGLSALPHTEKGDRITSAKNNQVMLDTFWLADITGGYKISPNLAVPLNTENTEWRIQFIGDQLNYDVEYQLFMLRETLWDSQGQEFKHMEILPSFRTVKEPRNTLLTDKCIHGKIVSKICLCDQGYIGYTCEDCAEGYQRNDSQQCDPIQVPEALFVQIPEEKIAMITKVIPQTDQTITDLKSLFKIQIFLSQTPYTNEGLLIDRDLNSDNMISSYALQKSQSKKLVRAQQVRGIDVQGKRWEYKFDPTKLQPEIPYKFVQIKNSLFTQTGKVFGAPQIVRPQFTVLLNQQEFLPAIPIDCQNGSPSGSRCQCYTGYTGKNCQLCAQGYYLTLRGSCKLKPEVSEEEPSSYLIVYIIVYSVIGLAILYLINCIRKMPRQRKYEPIELDPRPHSPEDDLDIHSTRFDHIRFRKDYDDQLYNYKW